MAIAFGDLKERGSSMRKLRGERVIPVVELSSKSMKTKWGMKLRPDFRIIDWVNFSGPATPAISGPVAKPTSAEIINDEIPEGLPF
jgi:hypothetical protein